MTDDLRAERHDGAERQAARWVAPTGKRIPRTRHGLLDSEALGRDWYSDYRPKRAEDLVGVGYSFVLLAPGGAGKSSLIERLRRSEPQSEVVDLRMHGRGSLASEIRTASARARSIFIDALDEALQHDSNLAYMLVSLLGEEAAHGVAWRLACRPGSWTLDLADGLRAALPGFEELELLPLDLRGVEEIAGPDAAAFLEAVERDDLTRQLAQPLHAQALLKQWRGTGALPATRSEAMRHTVGALLQETGRFRPPREQDDRRMALIAERLAAVSMLCGVGRFVSGSSVTGPSSSLSRPTQPGGGNDLHYDGGSLTATSVPLDEDHDLTGGPLTVEHVREVLGTTLFTTAGEGSVAFAHQSYAEFLAASLLTRRRVTGARLASLLGADVNGLAPGPMIEVLGWMLALGAEVRPDLVADNAKPLLSTAGMELADEQTRERVVDGLLRQASIGRISEGWGVDTSILAHPNLGQQLHEARRRATNHWEIFWIARIARHCLVVEAAGDLLAIAHDTSWPAFIRSQAIESFAAVAPVDRMGELQPLLELDNDEDPEDEVLGAALRAVLRGDPDMDHIARVLRPERHSMYIGSYSRLLGELPELIRPSDAIPLLTRVLSMPSTVRTRHLERMATGLMARGWETADADALAELGRAIGRESVSMAGVRRLESFPWENDDRPDLRRVMAAAALTTGGSSFMPVLDLRILKPSDLTWLIEWLAHAPPEALESARVVLRHLARGVADTDSVDHLLAVTEPHPAFAVLSDFQGSVSLAAKPDWVREEIEYSEGRPSRDQLVGVLRNAITDAQADLGTWWKCLAALVGDWEVEGYEVAFAWDLTMRPLWPDLEAAEQDVLWRLATEYVVSRQPEPERWVGRSRWNLDDFMPDWAAVSVFATAAEHRPEHFSELPESVWETWAPIIVEPPPFINPTAWQPTLLQAAPARARAALTAALRDLVRSGTASSIAHHGMADFSDPELLAAVELVAGDPGQPQEKRDEALGVLVDHAPATALEVARAVQFERDPPNGAARALAALSPEELLGPLLANGALPALSLLPRISLERLPDGTLSDLARVLLDTLPFADDPALTSGFSRETPESEARQVRVRVLQALAARGLVGHLEALTAGRSESDVDVMRSMLQRARERKALASWRPLEPGTMMKVVAQGDARFVRDSNSLANVLLEHLEHIQRDLHERSAFRSVWDGEPGEELASPKPEDDISDWLGRELDLRLSPHVVVDREIQVTRPSRKGVGTRIDITVTSPGGIRLGRVPFEAKHVQNRSLLTALDEQLVTQYLIPGNLTHGIYIVYWVHPSLRPRPWRSGHPDPVALAATLREQAQRHAPFRRIEVVVLDIGPRR